jgi:bifunctional DNA-binding transcriptional regulator/antitoxin component of YhaV-PrlF toxin-antitoxin module
MEMIVKLSKKSWVVIPAVLRKKHGLKPSSEFSVVDYGGVLTLVPRFKDPVRQGAGRLKSNGSLTGVIVAEHHQDHG